MRRSVLSVVATSAAIVLTSTLVGVTPANAHGWESPGHGSTVAAADRWLTPRTHFTMAADGSSGATQGGEGIPNIDSVKKTIATYYGDPGTGLANRTDSPYIREMRSIVAQQSAGLRRIHDAAVRRGEKPAIVLDADDTTLWTYDMEVADMHFVFDPTARTNGSRTNASRRLPRWSASSTAPPPWASRCSG
ncbi:hypothetical protein P9139_17925 [Curtobacterium flaccumfaciens]|nr:hypothetical protein P9139_17925 [Curtobacterium flaccumfaciens]